MSALMTDIPPYEERIAHLTRQLDDLSDIVADQAKRLERAERAITLLLERAAEAEADGGVVLADQRPPHW